MTWVGGCEQTNPSPRLMYLKYCKNFISAQNIYLWHLYILGRIAYVFNRGVDAS